MFVYLFVFGSWLRMKSVTAGKVCWLVGVDWADVEELDWIRKQMRQGKNLKAHIPEIYILLNGSTF